ncbi:insulin growth factor 1 receptor beta [Echinococcus multilocularis]|uniref:receptor protein-tyrosine kinase n=1 Tax=Echinococcus multilocularis TaxID=6211 RepID=A0A068YFK5_ECHMU|nr:insulin growth factor 1 receptor beta [Echinococcus multilocularis]
MYHNHLLSLWLFVFTLVRILLATDNECASPNDYEELECESFVLDLTQPQSLDPLINCTVINGNLIISGLSNTQCIQNGLSLPRLFQIFGSLIVEHSSCSGDLSHFLPNLIAIHGILPFSAQIPIEGKVTIPPYSLLIHHTALSGIGLRCLRVLGRLGVLLIDNPQMCYTDTIGWHLLTPSAYPSKPISNDSVASRNGGGVFGQDLLRKEGLFDLCANACPSGCEWVTVNNLPRSFCWSRDHCQHVCAAKCRDASLSCSIHNISECCHANCLGGCTGPTAGDCLICRDFHHNDMCLSSCPDGLYELYGRYCVTRNACLSKPIPRDLFSWVFQRSRSHPSGFSLQGRECVPVCDRSFRRSPSGECRPCGVDCEEVKRDCGDIVIYQQADLASVKDCLSARSVLISIRAGQDDLSTSLAEAFSSLRVIYRSLRVIRSDALLSLSFLHHLRTIHGTEPIVKDGLVTPVELSHSGITALEITWNGNLEDLWLLPPGSPKLEILSGSVEFSVNNRLCPDKIQSFLSNRVAFVTGRELTPSELDLINTSNGEYALCNAKPLNVTVVEEMQNSVTLRMNRMAWNDPRQILPAIISYGSENRVWDSDIYDHTFCDSAWNEAELNCGLPQFPSSPSQFRISASSSRGSASIGGGGEEVLTCLLENLAPATTYSAFITIATLSKHEGAQSRRFHFTTKPATPSAPTFLRAISAGPTSIQLLWNPPNRPNGKIVEYRIRYLQMKLEKNDFLSRDACYNIAFQQRASSTTNTLSDETGRKGGGHSLGSDDSSSVNAEVAEEEGEEASEGCDAFCKGTGSSASTSSSSTKGLKRSELLLEELQRREMIRFEDELHKIILIPRVYLEFDSDLAAAGGDDNEGEDKDSTTTRSHHTTLPDPDRPVCLPRFRMQRFYDYAHRDDYLYGYGSHIVRKRRDTSVMSTMSPQKTIHVPVSPESNGDVGGPAKLSFLVTGLEHFTEYLFLISACHEPHDEYGNPMPCTSEDCDLEQDAGCSQAVRISQRTQALPHADEVPSASLYALTPLQAAATTSNSQPPTNYSNDLLGNLSRFAFNTSFATSAATIQKETSASPVLLFWNEPQSPNGLILYYWLQYRRAEGASAVPEESSSLPWFVICVTPKYLEDDTAIKALAGLHCAAPVSKRGAVVIAEQAAKDEGANPQCDPATRTVFTELGFLRAGFYEWQVMAVSLAGNGSWTKSHFFDVQINDALQPSYIVAILVVTLLAVGFVIALAVWFDYRNKKRRMNALKNRKSEYLESLLLENFQDEWEVDPKDLSYNVEDTLGQGSFGLVCRGRLTCLTTPAAEYLHLATTFANGDSASPGGGGGIRPSSTHSALKSKKWLTSILPKRLRRGSVASGDAQGMDVAVKILSPGSTYEDVREFLGEASHMKQFNCNHIVRLLGIVSKQVLFRRQPIVVMELMQHGDLATYLRHRMAQEDYSQGSVSPEYAIKWAAEVADGMAYLEYKGFVHRDLAARNCLVGVGLTVKIGDFGLTRDVSGHLYYRKEGRARLPVRWMAPEALNEAYFTFKSDVWSYGVVLWEIATFAALPFSGLSHEEVIALVVNGGHLGKQGWPPKFPDILLDVMQACWHSDPECRPSFGTIISMLEPYVSSVFCTNSFYLNQNPDTRRLEVLQADLGGEEEVVAKGRERLLKPSVNPTVKGTLEEEEDGDQDSVELPLSH